MSQLEEQFQARIAQAKEAARLASIAAAARANHALDAPSFASIPAVPNTPLDVTPSSIENIPFDVKNRIDRLVEFVARNGDAFEAAAKEREANNPDFAFLKPGGPYSNYYQAKKQQMCGAQQVSMAPPAKIPVFPLSQSPLVSTDLHDMPVGAMANVCKFARASGVEVYAPIPREIILNVARLPPVEPARLEIRLLEFYRDNSELSTTSVISNTNEVNCAKNRTDLNLDPVDRDPDPRCQKLLNIIRMYIIGNRLRFCSIHATFRNKMNKRQ
ncbi:Splicing factor 3a, subunit 1 [Plasmopara halstedii]|uniref:Splicing factor 3a, subunit 1 n=1 Tax=Plasmopara halstedii TaxID=4781 RepID=A0A0P1AXI9_PLAHL|nr:Splicing factor 3a, subunit 1 [Plasmopara halstedii]CEG46154.1 Splicing factor 3a, subunit 1 [Plasmopara halstedii]|eukprot:XP_024582523.1 Splicing factor 3a, subunit 1 [Plasmopara halstedii]